MQQSFERPETIDRAEADRLLGLLRSTDPDVRDDVACTALCDLVSDPETDSRLVRRVVGRCAQALSGARAADDASILERSYACVVLNAVLAADLTRPFLSAGQWEAITDVIADWWRAEPDERGYDQELGWVHCLAHGADTILLASQSPHGDAPFRSECLVMIGEKLVSTTHVFDGYEDLRCALAFSAAVYGGCADNALARVSDLLRPASSPAPGTTPWAAQVNVTGFLSRLQALWTVGIAPCPPGFDGSVFRPPGVADAESLGWLAELLRQCDDFQVLARPGSGPMLKGAPAGKETR